MTYYTDWDYTDWDYKIYAYRGDDPEAQIVTVHRGEHSALMELEAIAALGRTCTVEYLTPYARAHPLRRPKVIRSP